MSCDLFELLVLPALGAPDAEDLLAWRAARHRACCAECAARAARFVSALGALNMAADLPALASTRWAPVASAAAQPAAQPARAAERDAALDWRGLARAVLVGVALAGALGVAYVGADSDFGLLQSLPSPLDGFERLGVAEDPLRAAMLASFVMLALAARLWVSRLFCVRGQCLA